MIRMRINKKDDARCCECGAGPETSLEMFDIQLGGEVRTICDWCNGQLFRKTLNADCAVMAKVKSKRDLDIIRKREKEGHANCTS